MFETGHSGPHPDALPHKLQTQRKVEGLNLRPESRGFGLATRPIATLATFQRKAEVLIPIPFGTIRFRDGPGALVPFTFREGGRDRTCRAGASDLQSDRDTSPISPKVHLEGFEPPLSGSEPDASASWAIGAYSVFGHGPTPRSATEIRTPTLLSENQVGCHYPIAPCLRRATGIRTPNLLAENQVGCQLPYSSRPGRDRGSRAPHLAPP